VTIEEGGMDAGVIALLIPIAAIVTGGVVKIVKVREAARQAGSDPDLQARLAAMEQELAAMRGELSETQERLDFTERLLAQAREAKRLDSP
jgi:alkylation response protein AidB-like acyl-CoA dehydrogenase